jgi:LysM repeat protein
MDSEMAPLSHFSKTTDIPNTTLSFLPSQDPSPRNSRGKVKKALFIGLAVSGASSLMLTPLLAYAGFFSALLEQSAPFSSAANTIFNSQTMPLLAAAINIDPKPTLGTADLTLVHGEALQPPENPDAQNGDTVTSSTNTQISVYTVRAGDSVSSIASMFGVSQSTIIGANNIQKGVIHPGEELIILPITGIQHTVLKGETLASLARTYHSDAHDIALYNNLADGDALTPGNSIIIPNGETTAPAAPKPKVTSSSAASKAKSAIAKVTAKLGITAPLRDAGGPEYDDFYSWPLTAGAGIITQSLHGYNGVDIGAPTGTNILAAAGGTVLIAKKDGAWNGGYGSYVVIAHTNGTQTLYAHASKVLVSVSDTVSQGELIAKVGRTGEATGPHLHFEVRGATNPFGAIPVGSGD